MKEEEKNILEKGKDLIQDKAEDIKEDLEELKEKAEEKFDDVKEDLGDFKEKAEEKFNDIKDKVEDKVDDIKEDLGEVKDSIFHEDPNPIDVDKTTTLEFGDTEVKEHKNIFPIIALFALGLIGLIGGTLAYFTSTETFPNIFRTKVYKTEISEQFESPDDWTPGTTTAKTVTAKNTGDVDIAVRVSFTEEWKDANNQTLPLEKENIRAAIINYADDYATKWTESTEGGVKYAYYKTKLASGETASSFIKSVTFNENVNNITGEKTTTTTTEGNTTTKTTTYSGYNGGTYTLTIKVETVQYDAYQDAWNTTVTIN